MVIEIGIVGGTGKMGKRLLELGGKDPDFSIVGTASRAHEFDRLKPAHLAIDFSHASLLPALLEFGLKTKKPLVIGTTGHEPSHLRAIEQASEDIPIFHAPNFSIGIAVLLRAVREIAHALPETFSLSIEETHHVHKKDAPSGTAIAIASAIPEKKRPAIQSKREGEVIGEHAIAFSSPEEKIILQHSALSRDLFARGALLAVKFLFDKPPGFYTMKDLL